MNKPLTSNRISALLKDTELLGKERGNLGASSAPQLQGAKIVVGISWRVPAEGSVEEETGWRGFQNNPQPFYAGPEWHITPSTNEDPLGNVVQEAHNIRTPSIVSSNGGLPESIENGQFGLILDAVTPEAIQNDVRRSTHLSLGEYKEAAHQHGMLANNTQLFDQSWRNALD